LENFALKSWISCRKMLAESTAFVNKYLQTIDPVIAFLQDKNPTFVATIYQKVTISRSKPILSTGDCRMGIWNFGDSKIRRAITRPLSEDLGDLIKEVVDPNFWF